VEEMQVMSPDGIVVGDRLDALALMGVVSSIEPSEAMRRSAIFCAPAML
jgi:hypothetical protein